MSYDTIGNIKTKNQAHDKLPYEGTNWIPEKGTSYNWNYAHQGTQPHAPTTIGERTFTYDKNGNQTGWTNSQNATKRIIKWDEENRISSISDNGQTSYYVYDVGGDRTLKRTAQGETFYVNAYFVIREGEVASKHFFAGSQRIVTKLTKQESQTVEGNGNSNKPAKIIYEKEQYYYHPDHLGSSSYVTDEKGKVYEHLEYFPFGETFAHEHSNTQVTPYRFTGKEYDEVTGLYYYGARYYDPRTSVWQSPDPILGEYMSGQTNGGVFNPKNLNMFGYTYNNPVNLVDPNGEFTYDPQTQGFYTDKGDTLSSISQLTGVSGEDLASNNPTFNKTASDTKLKGGQEVVIPDNDNIKAFKWATSKLGDKSYGKFTEKGNFKNPSNKCNLFVSDAYEKGAKKSIPRHKFLGFTRNGPATANELAAMGSSDIENAIIGDVFSFKRAGQSGHTTIYTGNVNIKGHTKTGGYGTIGASGDMVRFREKAYLDNAGLTTGHFLRIGE